MTKKKKKSPPKVVWVLFDKDGEECGLFMNSEDAHNDACGPRFRSYTVFAYKLVPKKEEPNELPRLRSCSW
jgi:hypothetical protein